MSEYKVQGKIGQIERRAAEKAFFKFLFMRARQKSDLFISYLTKTYISYSTRDKVEKDKIIFMHYNDVYQCNPKYIIEEILRQGLDYDIVFVTSKAHMNEFPLPFPEGVRVVRRNSLEHFYEAATARVWVDNAVCFPWNYVPKKKNQIYINTWHGSMGLKRIDASNIENKHWRDAAEIAGRITNFMISDSEFETMVYRTTHWPDERVKVLEYGHPRNDILFCDDKKRAELKAKVCEFFDIEEDCNLILYAPTFRDARNLDCYDLDYNRVIAAAEARFGGKWKIINRYHFKVAKKLAGVKAIKNNPDILSGNTYDDIQELMAVCDIGITDYSSWICDFVLTGRPGFIYANDLQAYDKERGFYYPLDSTPFPIAENNDQLEANILSFDADKYAADKEEFLKARGSKEDGRAAERVVSLLKRYMKEKKHKKED
ncbi:CDP-glycerol glycerophosphotransferase family protein [Ruminococcus sp.]|uniref:CDP-glycerol glycerophosphotransferase family protein n=1 Tax=Ruminococcus sp. TaxID=41978 RepID=UPI001AFE123D|nr:CDP-glycerol glycerophosphotransferase family protein [Ruminococcus sp.]MBO5557357.1 CDP-glycerol glycerophosphotransferase family protein [Ruminococcus sp.]